MGHWGTGSYTMWQKKREACEDAGAHASQKGPSNKSRGSQISISRCSSRALNCPRNWGMGNHPDQRPRTQPIPKPDKQNSASKQAGISVPYPHPKPGSAL